MSQSLQLRTTNAVLNPQGLQFNFIPALTVEVPLEELNTNPGTSAVAGAGYGYRYRSSNLTWYRIY